MGQILYPLGDFLNNKAVTDNPEHKFYFPLLEKYLALGENVNIIYVALFLKRVLNMRNENYND
jgi:hypothetical protein